MYLYSSPEAGPGTGDAGVSCSAATSEVGLLVQIASEMGATMNIRWYAGNRDSFTPRFRSSSFRSMSSRCSISW